MKLHYLLPFLLVGARAAPADRFTDYADLASGVLRQAVDAAENLIEHVFQEGEKDVNRWVDAVTSREYVKQNGVVYELVTHPSFPEYQIRVKSPSLCDPDVKQYSGYLDISETKHLFFWFFESRTAPSLDPLVLWLNGGPGCSSTTGLLFELGPCRIADDGNKTEYNPFSWNTFANMIFLDQPVDVGYSYSTGGDTVNTTPVAAVDVWSFLQLFLTRYSEYSELPFHVAAESYGGRYAPLIASEIYKQNQALNSAIAPIPGVQYINLVSVLLGNGLTDPYTQFASVPEYACDGPYPVLEGAECTALRSKVPTCQRLVKSCYNFDSKLTCVPAGLYCWSQLYGSFQQLGLNPYDVRKECDTSTGNSLCYAQMTWIETWMNKPEVKNELGGVTEIDYQSCNTEINQAFMLQGDGMHNSAAVIPELLEAGIRFLVYAGNADFMCNYMGNLEWMLALKSPLQAEFVEAETVEWRTLFGKLVGRTRSAGGSGAGNFTYVVVHEAGHMVPYDQPEAALDLFVRWITDVPLDIEI